MVRALYLYYSVNTYFRSDYLKSKEPISEFTDTPIGKNHFIPQKPLQSQ